jgi:hypothetical protein|nr:hypothetical protein [uncultured bacterium]AMP51382.1 hypothetical protein [uncultured bacterium]
MGQHLHFLFQPLQGKPYMPPDCAACPAALFSDFFLRQVLKVVQKDFFLRLFRQSGKSSRKRMLMYGKEASNRKQEIDRQHYTIPNQRPKDKHCGKI